MFATAPKITDALRFSPAFARRHRFQPSNQQKTDREQQAEYNQARRPGYQVLAYLKNVTEAKRKGSAGRNCQRDCNGCRREIPRTTTAATLIPAKSNLFEQFPQADLPQACRTLCHGKLYGYTMYLDVATAEAAEVREHEPVLCVGTVNVSSRLFA